MAGAVATFSHYVVMFAGLAIWQFPVLWSFLGATTGAVVGYVLNYVYTFESRLPHRRTTWRYAVVTMLSILLNTAIFFVLFGIAGLPALFAQLISTALVFVCNYFAHKHVTFDERIARSL